MARNQQTTKWDKWKLTFSQFVTQHVSQCFNLGTSNKEWRQSWLKMPHLDLLRIMTPTTAKEWLRKRAVSPVSKGKRVPNKDYFSSNGPSAIDFRRRDVWKFLDARTHIEALTWLWGDPCGLTDFCSKQDTCRWQKSERTGNVGTSRAFSWATLLVLQRKECCLCIPKERWVSPLCAVPVSINFGQGTESYVPLLLITHCTEAHFMV